MALTLDDADIDRLARRVAALTGETPAQAIRSALRERLRQQGAERVDDPGLAEALIDIARRCAASPTLSRRSEDEILGYGDTGV